MWLQFSGAHTLIRQKCPIFSVRVFYVYNNYINSSQLIWQWCMAVSRAAFITFNAKWTAAGSNQYQYARVTACLICMFNNVFALTSDRFVYTCNEQNKAEGKHTLSPNVEVIMIKNTTRNLSRSIYRFICMKTSRSALVERFSWHRRGQAHTASSSC